MPNGQEPDPKSPRPRWVTFALMALGLTAVGILLGIAQAAFEHGLEAGGHRLVAWIKTAPDLIRFLATAIAIAALVLVIFLSLALAVGFAWTGIVDSDSRKRKKALEIVNARLADSKRLGPILSSEDGSLVFTVLLMPKAEWTEKIPFFRPDNESHPAPPELELEKDTYAFPLFIRHTDGGFVSAPVSAGAERKALVTVVFAPAGGWLSPVGLLTGLHGIFSEAKLPLVSLAVTSICVFFLSYRRSSFDADLSAYWKTNFSAALNGAVQAAAPPKGLSLSRAEMRLHIGKDALPALVVSKGKESLEAWITVCRFAMHLFALCGFQCSFTGRLEWPSAE